MPRTVQQQVLTAPEQFGSIKAYSTNSARVQLKSKSSSFRRSSMVALEHLWEIPSKLTASYRSYVQNCNREKSLVVSCSKPNIGHLEAAAGIAGVIKVIAMLVEEVCPPIAKLRVLNTSIERLVNIEKIQFPKQELNISSADDTLYGGISSFGYAGTIAHAIISKYPGDRTFAFRTRVLNTWMTAVSLRHLSLRGKVHNTKTWGKRFSIQTRCSNVQWRSARNT